MNSQIPFIDFGGNGPLLHFAHANAYPPGCYRQFIEDLTPHFRVLAIEQRPLWPNSNPAELTSWELLADDLIRFFEQEGLENVIGVGHSLGGVATMYAAVKRPSLFRQLILIEPVFLPPELLKMAAANPDGAYKLPLVRVAQNRRNRWAGRQEAFDRFRDKSVFRRFSDDALWDYVNHATRTDGSGEFVLSFPREWEARVYAHPPLHVWEHLPQVTQPTLALRAAESDTIMPAAWQLWQALQPAATFIEIPDTGHMLTMERPSLIAQTILKHLQAG
ncbi:MAG: alpha/beta hydrolase [Ardenticatenaceae bacterium]|nr:alpha/beta hydrolase [Ardenticatenaceae bacterium]MCB9443801.1 alpha/beta hydrolase [Ardenticatenaceae bacterium]